MANKPGLMLLNSSEAALYLCPGRESLFLLHRCFCSRRWWLAGRGSGNLSSRVRYTDCLHLWFCKRLFDSNIKSRTLWHPFKVCGLTAKYGPTRSVKFILHSSNISVNACRKSIHYTYCYGLSLNFVELAEGLRQVQVSDTKNHSVVKLGSAP